MACSAIVAAVARSASQQHSLFVRRIATFAVDTVSRSSHGDLRELLWRAAGDNQHPEQPSGRQPEQQHSYLSSPHQGYSAAGTPLSAREAVQRCASRLTFSLAPGTPATYDGAVQSSAQPRLVTELHPPFRVVHANEAYERLFGWKASELTGMTLSSILRGPETDPAAVNQLREAALARARTAVTCVSKRKDGSSVVNRLQISPVYDACGHFSNMVVCVLQTQPGMPAEAFGRLPEAASPISGDMEPAAGSA